MNRSETAKIIFKVGEEARKSVHCFAKSSEKIFLEISTENSRTSVKILTDLQLSLRSSGTIFTDPQGKKAQRYVQILKESST